jgi:hypothetical protein
MIRPFIIGVASMALAPKLKTAPIYQELEHKRLDLENQRRQDALNRLARLGMGKNPAVKENDAPFR